MIRKSIILLLIVGLALLAGCSRDTAAEERQEVEISTIENTPTDLKPIRKPPSIEFDQGPAPALQIEMEETSTDDAATDQPVVPEVTTEWTENLPFSPKIAMDPVDGSKLSIRRATPIAEYKGRIYYFSSEANKREFIRSPDQFLSGAFAAY